jgi:hypothetical protein
VKFEFQNVSDTKVIKRIDRLVSLLSELMLRTQVLKMNPYMKNFLEKLLEIEKQGKQVIEILNEFQQFQTKWVYLQQIFN